MALIYDVPEAFGEAECDALVALGERVGLVPATVWARADQVDAAVRSAWTSHHPRGAETEWVYERLDRHFAEAGEAFGLAFGLAVGPVTEALQILRYDEGGHFQTWHSDSGYDSGARRLVSVSVELSAPMTAAISRSFPTRSGGSAASPRRRPLLSLEGAPPGDSGDPRRSPGAGDRDGRADLRRQSVEGLVGSPIRSP